MCHFMYVFHPCFNPKTAAPPPHHKKKDPLEEKELKDQHPIIYATMIKILLSAPYPFHQEGGGTTLIVQLK